ncbi:DUF6678 family protein [Flavobacterium sp. MMLR14_040]|uniref:DUF6678 family protein n=1 Tax=Flavobacterium sp. MMLR14_040 TaxID=3093843 RepID=UPI0029903402|nr:DUF6678 family protein [Flavobacterium sp. MMLR14_040]MDW8852074.1 DUF6678 family protein [Flavobacterium sp. MMLR14_040]
MKKYQPSFDELDKKLDKTIQQNFSSSYMSNQKWVKLINAFVANSEWIKKVEVKKILDERVGLLYISNDFAYQFDYWNIGFESSHSFGGWLLYKEIEFISFPSKFQNGKLIEEQNLNRIKEIINKVGLFELVEQDGELILFGYK